MRDGGLPVDDALPYPGAHHFQHLHGEGLLDLGGTPNCRAETLRELWGCSTHPWSPKYAPCVKNSMKSLFLCAIASVAASACSDTTTRPPTLDLTNFRVLEGSVVGGGQVDADEFPAMAEDGYSLVVNLRTEGEAFRENEGELARAAGMGYLHIPLGGGNLVRAHAVQLAAALDAHGDGHVLIHCGSGNRVGALWGLHVAVRDGLSADEGVQTARDSGMQSKDLADCVRAALTE